MGSSLRMLHFYKSLSSILYICDFSPLIKGTQPGLATHSKGVDVLLWDSCASLPSRRILSELNEGTEQHNVQGSFQC